MREILSKCCSSAAYTRQQSRQLVHSACFVEAFIAGARSMTGCCHTTPYPVAIAFAQQLKAAGPNVLCSQAALPGRVSDMNSMGRNGKQVSSLRCAAARDAGSPWPEPLWWQGLARSVPPGRQYAPPVLPPLAAEPPLACTWTCMQPEVAVCSCGYVQAAGLFLDDHRSCSFVCR